MDNEEYGRIYGEVQRHREIDEWTFVSPHQRGDTMVKLKATIKMVTGGRGKELQFIATSENIPEQRSPNIQTLREKVLEQFRIADIARHGVAWEDWLEIEISPDRGYRANTNGKIAGFTVSYSKMKRGTDPKTGKILTIHHSNDVVVPFPEPKAAGVVDVVKERWGSSRSEENQYSYIPATPQNISALDSLIAKMNELRQRLEQLLDQKVVAKELAGISTRFQLEDKT